MNTILERIADMVERGKVDSNSPYPPDLKGVHGVDELTQQALKQSINPNEILQKGYMAGMAKIGDKFSEGKSFIPELLMSAKAMKAGMVHLKPFFESGEATLKGTFVIGTVTGDLHDIGKNIVKMVMEGNGWKVIDLGVNVKPETFEKTLAENPGSILGMSALLTTTMVNMKDVVDLVKSKHPEIEIYIGGAPLSQEFCERIGATGFFHDPHGLVKHLS